MLTRIKIFLASDRGAVSVDWTVLSAAAVSMSLATVGVINGGIDNLVSQLEGELRSQQMSDTFVQFTALHFEPLLEAGEVTSSDAAIFFDTANEMMNQEIIDALEYGITALEEGELSPEDIVSLTAIASVAYQRNIIDDDVLEYYFGFAGDSPRYLDAL